MKTGTPEKLKFKQLKRRLRLTYWETVGVLESLWLATYANAPDGDIGRLSNEEIAAALEWEQDSDELVNALIDCRWLDRSDCFRLVVHDWSDHCFHYHKANQRRWGKTFADTGQQATKELTKDVTKDRPKEATKDVTVLPNLTQPNQTQPTSLRLGLAGAGNFEWEKSDKAAAIAALQRHNLSRAVAIANEAERNCMTAADLMAAIREYEANPSKFSSPGAIAHKVKTGAWPVDGVMAPEKIIATNDAKKRKAEEAAAESLFYKTVKDGNASGLSHDEIKVKVRAVLPVEFCERKGW